ncbi:MAG: glycosyltransferase family 39 protein [Planctomycetota bacterium]|nr:glycosyltransferase family 39 protein [Planctomycetota bacterium]
MVTKAQTTVDEVPDEGRQGGPAWRWPVLASFGLGALLRVAYVLALRDHPRFEAPTMDAAYHLAWARTLVGGETFQDGSFFRAPLYPYFLSIWTALSPGSTLLARLAQALLGGVAAGLTAGLACRVVGRKAAWWAGGFVALSPVMVAFDAELLIPVLLVPLLLWALDRCVAWGGDDRPRAAVWTGVLFGLAAIARPNVLLFMPGLFAWTIWRTRRPVSGLALALGTLMPIAPVTLVNVLAGDPALISTQAGVNFWIGNNPQSDGVSAIVPGTRQGWWDGFHDSVAAAERAEGRELRPGEVSRHYGRRALAWILSEPGDAARLFAWKARLLCTNVELANNQAIEFTARRTLPALRFSPSRWDVLFSLGVVGLVLAWRRRERGAGVLLGFLSVYSLSVLLFFVNARFRVPLTPVLAVGAGYSLVQLAGAWRRREPGRAAMIGVPVILLGVLSNLVPDAVHRSDAAGYADLGRAELVGGDAAAALQHLTTATALSPRSVQVRMALSSAILEATGDHERALRSLQDVEPFASAMDRAELEARIWALRINSGEAGTVLAEVSLARRTRPDEGALRFVQAMAQAACGQAPGAIGTLQELVASEPTNVAALLFLGSLEEELGRRQDAHRTYTQASALGRFATPVEAAAIGDGLQRCGGR